MTYESIIPEFSYAGFTEIATVDISGLRSLLDPTIAEKPLFVGVETRKVSREGFAQNLAVYVEMQVRQDYFAYLLNDMHQANVPNEQKAIADFILSNQNNRALYSYSQRPSVVANSLESVMTAIQTAIQTATVTKALKVVLASE